MYFLQCDKHLHCFLPQQFDRMPYSPAGSRYLLYRYGSGHPNYADLREDQFYYEWCFLRNISTPTGAGSTTSWGRPWGDFGVRTVHGRPDIYLDSFSRTSTNPEAYTRLYVTLTDNKTFALVVACWNAENISSWHVISSTPRLSEKTLNLIESHAESYGFPRENFVRVRYDTCRRDDGRYLFSHDSIIDGAGRRRNYLY